MSERPTRGLLRYARWVPPTGNGWHTQHWCRGVRRNVRIIRSNDEAQLTCLVCSETMRMSRKRLA